MSDVLRVLDLGCGDSPTANWTRYGLADEVRRLIGRDASTLLDVNAIDCKIRDNAEFSDAVKNIRLSTRRGIFQKMHLLLPNVPTYDVGLLLYPYLQFMQGLVAADMFEEFAHEATSAIDALKKNVRPDGIVVVRSEAGEMFPDLAEPAMRIFAERGNFTPVTPAVEPSMFERDGQPKFIWNSPQSWGRHPAKTWLFRNTMQNQA